MVTFKQQIEGGQLVCPLSRQRLSIQDGRLVTGDGLTSYPLVGDVPILLDEGRQAAYLAQLDQKMEREYVAPRPRPSLVQFLERLSYWGGDRRSEASREAFRDAIERQPEGALCLSVGGGPHRIHPQLVNLNIGLFPNVDVVADAYQLPYANGTVDAVYCEAVLEHLEFPNEAVREMYRVLKPGGKLFAATPFLQKFHGYPNHFQNFTLTGHERLFARAGFTILSAGVCVGPTFALVDFLALYVKQIPSRLFGKLFSGAVRLFSAPLRALDIPLNRRPDAHVLASSTFVFCSK